MTHPCSFDLHTLSRLSRPELQETALRYNINTMLKSETIIKRLLAAKPGDRSSDFNISSSEAPLTAGNLATHNAFIGIPSDALHVPRRPKPPPEPRSDYSFPSPVSSEVGNYELLASQEQLKATVHMMASMDSQQKVALQEIHNLQTAAGDLREQVKLLRQKIVGQRSRRQRLQLYMLYWRKEPLHWSYKEVWDYPLRIWDERFPDLFQMEVTSSNGEGPTEEEREGIIAGRAMALKHMIEQIDRPIEDTDHYDFLECIIPASSANPEVIQYPDHEELENESLVYGVANVLAHSKESILCPSHPKRRREEDEDETLVDAERYQPRTCRNVGEQRSTSLQQSNPGSSQKGKEKMSADEVQRMQEEAEREHLHGEQETENDNNKEYVIATLGLWAEEIEEDEAVSMIVESRHSSEMIDGGRPPTPIPSSEKVEENQMVGRKQYSRTTRNAKKPTSQTDKGSTQSRRPKRSTTAHQKLNSRII
ncbi:hypothetical protein BDQ17DRAFT_1419894 [Cyathus striatus]|nr:hypothetical protein BDQ17DRAFT_1419894 [Cyathus striatus]